MIQHTVAFRLKHPAGSAAERDFLDAARRLATIDGVQRFECLRQVGRKNRFQFGLSMVFDSEQAYAAYDADPRHVDFVQSRWLPEVSAFIELDYQAL